MSQIVSAAAGVWVHLRELALVVAGGNLASSFPTSGEGNSRGWCRVETMMEGVAMNNVSRTESNAILIKFTMRGGKVQVETSQAQRNAGGYSSGATDGQ